VFLLLLYRNSFGFLGTLNQIHTDLNKRVEQLSHELVKVNNNATLTDDDKHYILNEKYEILMSPIVYVLEHVYEITRTKAETPNEEQFINEFSLKIENALGQLKNNKQNCHQPSNSWSLLKHFHHLLFQRSQRRNLNTLSLEQISPKLAAIKSSTIPIPGKNCAIHSIALQVHILPTKTKPKKLFFVGTNGKRYPFLFKGLEDLHLDERIMQLLSTINTMFSKINKSEYPSYNAINYSVTPLGPRSGLIAWIDGAVPLFSLYKKWQQRELVHMLNKPPSATATTNAQQILRPSDLYMNKLNQIIKEKGLNKNKSRTDYPISVLRLVLEELIKDTPQDLLSKELWCSAPTPASWWNSIQQYTRSIAVMSIIGYIIGLGDRHLDNVLINLQNGSVAHIDYNICFEKGECLLDLSFAKQPECDNSCKKEKMSPYELDYSHAISNNFGPFDVCHLHKQLFFLFVCFLGKLLRIPEKIPFRLTQNILHAFGVNGIEGMFRQSCEYCLKVLRTGRETLLTLLEAFVYDPLLDWTGIDTGIIASYYGAGHIAQQQTEASSKSKLKRKNFDKILTYRLYNIRLMENRVYFQKNQDRFQQLIVQIDAKLQQLLDSQVKLRTKDNLIKLYDDAKVYLDEGLVNKTHAVYSLHDRYREMCKFKSNHEAIKNKVKQMKTDYEQQFENTKHFLRFFIDNEQSTTYKSQCNDITPIAYTTEFLQSISQQNYIQQCEQLELEMRTLNDNCHTMIDTFFRQYAVYLNFYKWLPHDVYKHNRQYTWLTLCNNLDLTDYSCETLHDLLLAATKQSSFSSSSSDLDETLLANKSSLIKNEINIVETKLCFLTTRKMVIANDVDRLKLIELQLTRLTTTTTNKNMVANEYFIMLTVFNYLNENLKKWSIMENAIVQAKDQLLNLNSKDGDWFIEEILSLILNCEHLMSLLAKCTQPNVVISESCESIGSMKNWILSLKNLLFAYSNSLYGCCLQMALSNNDDYLATFDTFKSFDLNGFEQLTHLDPQTVFVCLFFFFIDTLCMAFGEFWGILYSKEPAC
jgi:hypothetical protein